ncbi:aldose 1-epimerase [Paracoccus sediminicola]|uniref:aldose 1-epimerase n=1 Tax=Paracoccus sediminicola TaxID=3017783 RepID=UPI0022F06DAB|nr:aldose 1-epimerase [Paracoccus sediminicola]WBU56070.1 aldose 1-epimerase [Paracoccus sediminicola]
MLVLRNDDLVLHVSRRGGALTELLTASGEPLLRGLSGPFDVRRAACFPLVPLGNRIGGNLFHHDGVDYVMRPNTDEPLYLHGDGWLEEWSAQEVDSKELRLTLDHLHPQHGPHHYHAEQRIELDGPALRLSLSLRNEGPVALPFGIGFHPYFPNDGARIGFDARTFWTQGADKTPETRTAIPADFDFSAPKPLPDTPLDNAFEGWDGQARIDWPERNISLRIAADPVFSTLMVYAPEEDRSFFCLEPMSHLPDALRLQGAKGMRVLAPGETLAGGIELRMVASAG